jgi:hypothetical protein
LLHRPAELALVVRELARAPNLTVVRTANFFGPHEVDPLHYRRVHLTVRVDMPHGGYHFCEVEVQLVRFYESRPSVESYGYFEPLVAEEVWDGREPLSWPRLHQLMQRWTSLLRTPMVLSMLAVAMRAIDFATLKVDAFPTTKAAVYEAATWAMLEHELRVRGVAAAAAAATSDGGGDGGDGSDGGGDGGGADGGRSGGGGGGPPPDAATLHHAIGSISLANHCCNGTARPTFRWRDVETTLRTSPPEVMAAATWCIETGNNGEFCLPTFRMIGDCPATAYFESIHSSLQEHVSAADLSRKLHKGDQKATILNSEGGLTPLLNSRRHQTLFELAEPGLARGLFGSGGRVGDVTSSLIHQVVVVVVVGAVVVVVAVVVVAVCIL